MSVIVLSEFIITHCICHLFWLLYNSPTSLSVTDTYTVIYVFCACTLYYTAFIS